MVSNELNEPNQTPIEDAEEEIELTQETNVEESTTDSKMELDWFYFWVIIFIKLFNVIYSNGVSR